MNLWSVESFIWVGGKQNVVRCEIINQPIFNFGQIIPPPKKKKEKKTLQIFNENSNQEPGKTGKLAQQYLKPDS